MGSLELAMIAAIVVGTALVVAFGYALNKVGLLEVPDQSRRIGCMDGLRGFLASGAMVRHFAMWPGLVNNGVWRRLDHAAARNFGSGGVSLFFMDSGALFYGRVRGRSPRSIGWRALHISRPFQIVPLLIIAVACVIGIASARGADPATFRPIAAMRWLMFLGLPDMFANLAQPSRMEVSGVIWTLRYEWAFHAPPPLVARAFVRPSATTRLALTAGLTVVLALRGRLALGEISYGIHLPHDLTPRIPAQDLGSSGPTDAPATWAAPPGAMIAVTTVAALSHRLIETPCIAPGRTAASRLRGRPAPAG